MNKWFPVLFLPSIICALGSVLLLYTYGGASTGWGWLLFGSMVLYPSGSTDKDDE